MIDTLETGPRETQVGQDKYRHTQLANKVVDEREYYSESHRLRHLDKDNDKELELWKRSWCPVTILVIVALVGFWGLGRGGHREEAKREKLNDSGV